MKLAKRLSLKTPAEAARVVTLAQEVDEASTSATFSGGSSRIFERMAR